MMATRGDPAQPDKFLFDGCEAWGAKNITRLQQSLTAPLGEVHAGHLLVLQALDWLRGAGGENHMF